MNLPADSGSVVTVVTDQIDKKLQTTLDVGAKALQSSEVQAMIQAYGLQDYIKNVKQEQVKNLLAVVGTYFMIAKFKKHWPWVLGGFGALYLYAKSTGASAPANTIANNTNKGILSMDSSDPNSGKVMSGYNNSMY